MSNKRPLPIPSPNLEASQYEFTLTVTTCEMRLKFPCTFTLSWKIDKEVVESADRIEPNGNRLEFNTQLRVRTTVVTSSSVSAKMRKKASTLCINYWSKSRPNEMKLAGFLTIDLAEYVQGSHGNGNGVKQFPLERCPDKDSLVEFSITSVLIRNLTAEQVNESFSFLKLVGPQSLQRTPSYKSFEHNKPDPGEPKKLSDTIMEIANRYSGHRPRNLVNETPLKRNGSRQELQNAVVVVVEPRKSFGSQRKGAAEVVEPSTDRKTQQGSSKQQIPPPPAPLPKVKSQKQLLSKIDNISLQTSLSQKQNQNLKLQIQQLSLQLDNANSKLKLLQRKQPQLKLLKDSLAQANTKISKLEDDLNRRNEAYAQLEDDLRGIEKAYEAEVKVTEGLQQALEGREREREEREKRDKQEQSQKELDLEAELNYYKQVLGETQQMLQEVQESNINLQQQLQHLKNQKLILSTLQNPPPENTTALLQQRIQDLQSQLSNTLPPPPPPPQQSLDFVYDIIDQFTLKQQQINTLFETISQQCMKLIEAIRNKQHFEHMLSEKLNEVALEFASACSSTPICIRQKSKQHSTLKTVEEEDSQLEEVEGAVEDAGSNCKGQEEGQLQEGEKPATNVFIEDLQTLKSEYSSRLRSMYEQILHLNQVLYERSAHQKQTLLQLQQARDRYSFFQKTNIHLQSSLRLCRQQHQPALQHLNSQLLSKQSQIAHLNSDIASLENQINSLMGELQAQLVAPTNLSRASASSPFPELKEELYEQRMGELARENQELRAQLQEKGREIGGNGNSGGEESNGGGGGREDVKGLVELLKAVVRSREDSEGVVKRMLVGEFVPSAVGFPVEKLSLMNRIREMSVDFQRLKADRLNALQGNSELRKDFLKSIRPMQARLDELLGFGQGLLNCKTPEQCWPAATPLRISTNH